jgi:DNA-binding beta-propeller fold protein YncE
MFRSLLNAAVLAAVTLPATSSGAPSFYRLESSLTLPSLSDRGPSWDYLTFDQERSHLYVSCRHDGIFVYDTKVDKIIGTLEDSVGGNSTRLVPECDRAYVIKQNGTATAYRLSTRTKIEHIECGDNADNVFYDPVSKQLMVTMSDSKQVAFLDARTGRLVGKLSIDSAALEGAAPDGEGNFFLALKDRNKVIRINVAERRITAEWPTEGCELVCGLDYDRVTKRIFVGGRGDRPVLAVLDSETGKVVARETIGRGNDAVIFDPESRRIYTANGVDGNLVVIDQVNADTYKLAEAATTRPFAKTMAVDFKTKKVYLVTAEGTVDPSKKNRRDLAPFYPNKFFPGTFQVLTYSAK